MTGGGSGSASGDGPEATNVLGLVIALVVVGVLGFVVLGDDDPDRGSPTAPTDTPAAVSPLTGLPEIGEQVLAVKVDNTVSGRPRVGVEDADVVYVEPVEGGLTRLVAVFASRLPDRVGPVRSARETDLGILAAFGRPALGFSGNAPELDARLASSGILLTGPDQAGDAHRRADGRPAPYDLLADPGTLLDAAPDASPPRDVGFTFGPPPPGGTPATEAAATVGNATVGVTWDAGRGRWTVRINGGEPEPGDGPATVVVQRVAYRDSGIRDVAGSVSPVAETVGEGAVEVLRDGTRYEGRWSRPAPDAPTRFTLADGSPMPFAAGPVRVLLVRA